ncbi:drug/metabolite transporter (DMT)-like permease [Chitinivorax tropicus]|uniref:Drug/metabolite transporter (DMT)-like permease n=1 Tax=Chitinivorax tropicus TaxID=714531 RepID=A0A840MIR0_9PROT|nr:DMT family transporter [Chitinivorax tropicus]MBB5018538.1 drug/metabolite transporter (DMT)-like permease [Chitinivorax tropicus]
MSTHPRLSYFLLTLTSLFWSGNFVVARATHAAIAPMTLSFARWTIALLILLPWVGKRAWLQRQLLRTHYKRIVLLGILGVAGFNSFVYAGLQYTTAMNAVLLNSFIPILIVLIGWAFQKQALSRASMIGILTSFGGVMLIVSRADWQTLTHLSINQGDALVFCAVVCWAIYTVLLRGLPQTMDRLAMLVAVVAVGWLVLALPFTYEVWGLQHHTDLNLPNLLTFLYVGIFPSVLAYLFYNRGVADVGPAKAGAFIHLMPAFGSILAMLFLGEKLQSYHAGGIALIFCGIYLNTRQ